MSFNDGLLRVGVVGAGRIVERVHLPLLCRTPGVRVVGLFDPDEARARAVAAGFGVPTVCGRLEELCGLGLDAALVASPNRFHPSDSIALLEAGAHVMCEKPMAVSAAEAEAMAAAAASTGRELMIGFTNRFRPEVEALRRAILGGQLGEVASIRCGWLRRNGVPGAGTWFTRRDAAGGGALIDIGSHLVDLSLWLGGRSRLRAAACVLDTQAMAAAQASWYSTGGGNAPAAGDADVESGARGFVLLDGNFDLFVEANWACGVPYDQTYLHVLGDRGAAKVETLFGLSPSGRDAAHSLRVWGGGALVLDQPVDNSDPVQPYRAQWEFFFDSLRRGRSLRALTQDGVAAVRVIEAMYDSARRRAGEPWEVR